MGVRTCRARDSCNVERWVAYIYALLDTSAEQRSNARLHGVPLWWCTPIVLGVFQSDAVPAHTCVEPDEHAAQVVTDFFDELKSRSKGYASMEYSITGYRANDLVRLDVKINNEVRSRIRRASPCCVHCRQAVHIKSECMTASCAMSCNSLHHIYANATCLLPSHVASLRAMASSDSGAAGVHRAPRGSLPRGPQPGEEAQGAHPAAAVPHPDPGRHRLARHRIRGNFWCAPSE